MPINIYNIFVFAFVFTASPQKQQILEQISHFQNN